MKRLILVLFILLFAGSAQGIDLKKYQASLPQGPPKDGLLLYTKGAVDTIGESVKGVRV